VSSLVFLTSSDKINGVFVWNAQFLQSMLDRIVIRFVVLCLFCLSLPLLSGCTKKAGAESAGPSIPPAPEVIVATVSMDDVQIYIYTEGKTVPSNAVDIRARVSGYLEELFFKPGAIVKEGDRLALIEQAAYQVALDAAKADLANAKAQTSLAEANLARAKTLLDNKVGTAEEYETQRSVRDVALAGIDRAEAAIRNAELNLQYTDMYAPITGKTTKNLVDKGNFVSPTGAQSVLLSITQLDPMYVEFKLNDRQFIELKDRLGLRDVFNQTTNPPAGASPANNTSETPEDRPLALTGMPVDVSLMTGVDVFKFDFNIPGKVVALVDNQINWSTATFTLRAEVQNPLLKTNGVEDYMIYAGQVCRVRIPYEKVENAILVREEAILTDLDTKYVLIVEKGMFQPKDPFGRPLKDAKGEEVPPYETDIVHRRDIVLGRLLDTQMRIVLDGVKPGDVYIDQGVQRVRIGSAVQPITLEEYKIRRAAAKNGK
jgi:RND family efflux transporter MFP subunit